MSEQPIFAVENNHASGEGTTTPPLGEQPGMMVGRYRLLQAIGEGGMGVVFMAEQREPVRRTVALKIIKPGMDTAQVVARFEAERQALALMDHPNIAKVLDAGATETGRPYFVMELVKGVPLGKYCDDNHLSPHERLELFVPICQAIQHAHQKGIIHRDVKPSNVLVMSHDGKAVPKVIDFGVAKATSQRLTDKTMFTEFGQVVGTLEYMSPEQAEMSSLDVDTRSDVYSLGVLLYQLLTGSTPFERKRLRAAALDEMLRIIREEEPPRPSTRISESGAQLATIAAQRKMEPKQLSGLLRGELDWIVMKALEKDRNRRYQTASGLALDLQRYLADEPVEACPPSASYRLRKFASKHRHALVLGVVLITLLVAGTAVSTWQAIRATLAERDLRAALTRAEAAEKDATTRRDEALEARKVADDEAAVARAVSEFLQNDLLAQAGVAAQIEAQHAPQKDLKVRTVLDRAAATLDGRFGKQPLTEAALRETLGLAYRELGEYDTGLRHLRRALDLRQREQGDEHPRTLEVQEELALLHLYRGDADRAEEILRQALTVCRRIQGEDHEQTARIRYSLGILLLRVRKQLAEAQDLLIQAVEVRRRKFGASDVRTLEALGNLGFAHYYRGQIQEAESLLHTAADGLRSKLGVEHPLAQIALTGQGLVLSVRGEHAKAERIHQELLDVRKAVLGPEHPATLFSMINLAEVYHVQGKLEQAENLMSQTLEARRRVLGTDHFDTLVTMYFLARVYRDREKFAEAEGLLRETQKRARAKFGGEHELVFRATMILGEVHHVQKKYREAEVEHRECLRLWKKQEIQIGGAWHTYGLLAASLVEQQKYADAEPMLLAIYDHRTNLAKTTWPPGHFRVKEDAERLVKLYEAWGKPEKAAEWRKKMAENP